MRSSGSIAILETCSAEAPSYSMKISTMGTDISGSSWRGVISSPSRPANNAAMYNKGDSGESMKVLATLPAMPSWLPMEPRSGGGFGYPSLSVFDKSLFDMH